jgi:hypothetical protein
VLVLLLLCVAAHQRRRHPAAVFDAAAGSPSEGHALVMTAARRMRLLSLATCELLLVRAP